MSLELKPLRGLGSTFPGRKVRLHLGKALQAAHANLVIRASHMVPGLLQEARDTICIEP